MSDWIEDIHALADGELEGEAKERTTKLVETNESAAIEFEWAKTLKHSVNTKCVNKGHEDAWKKCQARLDELDSVGSDTKVESFVGRFGWVMASVLFVLIIGAGVLNRGMGSNELSNQQFSSLFTGEALFEKVEVDGAQEADEIVRARMGTKLPYVEPIVQLQSADQGYIDGKLVLRFHFIDNVGPLSLVIFEDVDSIESLETIPERSEYSSGQYNGLTVISWSKDNQVCMVVADRSIDELVRIADKMREEPE